jgi:hypothetical protein
LDIGVIQRHDPVQIAVFPAQVVTHDRLARGLGLQRAIILGVHERSRQKVPSLPKSARTFNCKCGRAIAQTITHVTCIKKSAAIAKRPEKYTFFSHAAATFKVCQWLSQ